jgi:hypothetical protein
MNIDLRVIAFFSGDGVYRPSLWVRVPRRQYLVLWFGWQRPSVTVLAR